MDNYEKLIEAAHKVAEQKLKVDSIGCSNINACNTYGEKVALLMRYKVEQSYLVQYRGEYEEIFVEYIKRSLHEKL